MRSERFGSLTHELYDIEAAHDPDANFDNSDQVKLCSARALGALRRLGPDYFGVDGGVLVRSMAWLSTCGESVSEVQELLGAPQAIAVLLRDYGDNLKDYLMKNYEPELAGLLRSFSPEGQSLNYEAHRLTDEQTMKLGKALRHVIRARDNAQGYLFT